MDGPDCVGISWLAGENSVMRGGLPDRLRSSADTEVACNVRAPSSASMAASRVPLSAVSSCLTDFSLRRVDADGGSESSRVRGLEGMLW